jgi:hypothetical protein
VIEDDGGQVLARIIIEQKITVDGDHRVDAMFSDGDDENGQTPAAVTLLGMLEMTKDTVLHGGIYDDEDDD